jgi:hypothetical protein
MGRNILRSALLAWVVAALGVSVLAYAKSSSNEYKGSVKGEETKSFTVSVAANQTLSVSLKASRSVTSFNVTAPGASEALWVGAVEGSDKPFHKKLEAAGEYRIDVLLDRAAAHRNGKADFTLLVSVVD